MRDSILMYNPSKDSHRGPRPVACRGASPVLSQLGHESSTVKGVTVLVIVVGGVVIEVVGASIIVAEMSVIVAGGVTSAVDTTELKWASEVRVEETAARGKGALETEGAAEPSIASVMIGAGVVVIEVEAPIILSLSTGGVRVTRRGRGRGFIVVDPRGTA